ncbi:MAG: tRNA lysidine(34) synthetase TilS, partial [Burkholderiales bacterium]
MIIQHIKQKISEYLPTERSLVVGLSGGIDSVVLTDAVWSLSGELDLNLEVVHVNHQLMAEANDWERFCKDFCAGRGLSFRSERVAINRSSPLGIEGAAREERYRIFSESDRAVLVLAHHLDDQVETFFLQLLRGSGVDGLGSMPEFYLSTTISKNIFRPLLGITRDDLVLYAKERKLRWVDDPSNDSNSMNRNFLRHEILPLLKKRFPSMGQTLNRSIENIATASFMLDKFAERDLIESVTPKGGVDLNILEKWDDVR